MTDKKNVVDMTNFSTKKIDMDDLSSVEKIATVMGAAAKNKPINIVMLALDEDGRGSLFHTVPESKFNLIGSLYLVLHWLTSRSVA